MALKFSRRLLGILDIEYTLKTETGLIIRFPLSKVKIGGADTMPMTVIKKYEIDKKEEEIEVPYIPGSSIKGRMRGLLELKENVELYSDGKITQHFLPLKYRDKYPEVIIEFVEKYLSKDKPESFIDHVFGYSAIHYEDLKNAIKKSLEESLKNEYRKKGVKIDENKIKQQAENEAEKKAKKLFGKLAITRLIVYDIYPSKNYVEKLFKEKRELGLTLTLDDFLEEKPENRIDRITSAADPRTILRIKPDVQFEGLMRLLIFDRDNQCIEHILKLIFSGIKLIEDTFLGGSGSRGYGKVTFTKIKLTLKTEGYYREGKDEDKIEIKINGKKIFESVEEVLKNIEKIAKEIRKNLEKSVSEKVKIEVKKEHKQSN